jgi:hypothetical protein
MGTRILDRVDDIIQDKDRHRAERRFDSKAFVDRNV